MSPRGTSTAVVATSTDLSALTADVSRAVTAGEFVPNKRTKHAEKAKVQQLTRQLAMRLQYAKLKVDHGWARQNLNEVENLYFHHYRNTRQPPPQPIQRRAGGTAAAAQASRAQSMSVQGPETGVGSSSKATANALSAAESSGSRMGAHTSSNVVDDDAAASSPSVPEPARRPEVSIPLATSTTIPSPTELATPTTTATQSTLPARDMSPNQSSRMAAQATARQVSRSRPYPSSVTSIPSFASAATDGSQTQLTSDGSSSSMKTTPSPQKAASQSRQPVKSSSKSRTASYSSTASPVKHLTKTVNKNTSTPSTLQPPQTTESTTAYRLPNSGGSGGNGKGSGPTSYESFWSSLGTGGLAGMAPRPNPSSATSSSNSLTGITSPPATTISFPSTRPAPGPPPTPALHLNTTNPASSALPYSMTSYNSPLSLLPPSRSSSLAGALGDPSSVSFGTAAGGAGSSSSIYSTLGPANGASVPQPSTSQA